MNENVEIVLPNLGTREIVLREQTLVSLNKNSANVRVETIYQYPSLLIQPPPTPQITNTCDKALTWTFSSNHITGLAGVIEIHLNKFLYCVPSTIEGVIYSNYIGSWPSFTATPESEEPIFLTFTIDGRVLQPPQGQHFFPLALDIRILVRSWKPDGTFAPNITFNWIAIAQVGSVTNI